MNIARRLIVGAVAGLGVTLLVIVGGLIPRGLSSQDVPALAAVVGAGFALVVLVCLLAWLTLRLGGHQLVAGSSALLGLVAALVATLAIAYGLEGFEYGVAPLLTDPVSWIWFVGFCLGGACFLWMGRPIRDRP